MVQAQDPILAAMLDRIAANVPGPAGALTRPLYGGLGPADLTAVRETILTAGVPSLWQFMAERPPGTVRLRIHQPDWAEGGVVAEIVNDDMPFLVDSTVAIFNRHGLSIEALAHPILPIRRDEAGRLIALGDGPRESVMSIHLSGSRDDAVLAAIERDLLKTLADVRAAVSDWRAMLHRLSLATAELDDPALAASGIAPVEIAETKAFLRWLADNHFTLLGYREYRYDDTPDGKVMRVLDESNLGIMRDPTLAVLHGHRNLAALTPDIRAFLEAPQLLFIAKANQRSPVHRPVHMDIIGVKRLDESGQVVAERRFIGLFTSGAYSDLPAQIPILRQKVASVMTAAGFAPASHDGKALAQILDTYPRDELFTIPTPELFDIALGVLRLQDRRRIALFLRRDPFERFLSCLVYVPRDRYDAALRDRFHALLADAFGGSIAASYIHLSEAPLARLHVIVKTSPGTIPAVDVPALEAKLIAAGRNWADDLMQALTSLPQGGALARRYAGAFDAAYCDHHSPAQAVADLLRIDGLVGDQPACRLDNSPGCPPETVTFRLYRRDEPVPLSDVLPILEHHGLRVLTENPYRIHPAGQGVVWLHDFAATSIDGTAIDADAVRSRFEAGFLAGWSGTTEEDGFNRLILSAGLEWREASILRSYAQYLRQIGFTYSRRYIEATLAKYPTIAARLVGLFHARLDPQGQADAGTLETTLRQDLDAVAVADEDRILRRYLDLILATLRTNYYQRQPDGQPKPYLAIKLDSAHLDGLPKPRPQVEIWVSSPDVEAVHLRGGKVARGGIRWSDRREDFRTEILGLIKAQMVKNAVIVPVGSKGGFVVKRPPPAEAGRPALMAQVIACYRTLMSGLLDLTDNRQGDRIVPPANVRRLDGDDPYLVVAADKGTATFSDIANGIAQDYGFWLDDAFASGGSAGYDHKALGITAAGAWVAVERHLREIGIDLHRQGLSMVGVGDMSGDVFGNGLLHSDQVRLCAAFDHRHIFLDPDPDPARSFAERKRLFALTGSSWADYDPALLSPGGMVIPRSAKSVTISAQAMAVLGLDSATLTPADLMQAILKAPVDLLWFGGIGTYIKAAGETHAQIGDRANDAIRIDGRDIRAKVVGEGANLGVTQRGRIEYALRGGRINSDAVDNSAGVDCSDHEVNIKILTADLIGRGQMDRAERDRLLASMATEVARLVLRDNDRQTFTLSMAERDGALMVDAAPRLIQRFARTAGLDRALEALPEDGELANRSALVRPELAVLLAFAKMDLYNALLASSLPDDPALAGDLLTYFPAPLQRDHADAIRRHGLRREITATQMTNSIIDRGGIDFVASLVEETGASPAAIAAGFCAIRDLFDLPSLWATLDGMDQVEHAATQIDLARATAQALRQAVAWVLRMTPHGQDAAPQVATLADPWRAGLASLRTGGVSDDAASRLADFQAGVRMLDVLPLVHQTGVAIDRAAALWAEIGERFQFDKVTLLAQTTPQPDSWSRRAVAGLLMDLAAHRQHIAGRILARLDNADWQSMEAPLLVRWDGVLAALLAGPIDLARLTIAEHTLRSQIL